MCAHRVLDGCVPTASTDQRCVQHPRIQCQVPAVEVAQHIKIEVSNDFGEHEQYGVYENPRWSVEHM